MSDALPQLNHVNDKLVMIVGKSSTGKSASLKDLRNPEKKAYFNCESGKKLPFRSKFREFVITDPYEVHQGFDWLETQGDAFDTAIVDTTTYLMDMFESVHVIPAKDTMKAWGGYAQYWKNLMQYYVAKSTKNVIMLAHTTDKVNEAEMALETYVPIKGSVKGNGVESYFSCIIASKKIKIKDLEGFQSPLLTITPQEAALGYKHVFQTQLTKETVGERLRSPMGMWEPNETYIDNNAQLVLDRLDAYYA